MSQLISFGESQIKPSSGLLLGALVIDCQLSSLAASLPYEMIVLLMFATFVARFPSHFLN